MLNTELYEMFRTVPESAKKTIGAGRLKGMTDINPMWRIQKLTEQFGPCGTGWKYIIRDKRLEPGCNGEIAAFVDIDLYYKTPDGWSDAVPGTGGSSFVANERSGLHISDECYKMALTDALSVACKALGMGADVYWAQGRTKYNGGQQTPSPDTLCDHCGKQIKPRKNSDGTVKTVEEQIAYSLDHFQKTLCGNCIIALSKPKGGKQ